MKKISLTSKDIENLKNLFEENYLMIKQINDIMKKTRNLKLKHLLKEIKNIHIDNLITIMKIIDDKERIL